MVMLPLPSATARYSQAMSSAAVCAWLTVLLVSLGAVRLSAQDPDAERLMDQAPFDILTLDKANESKVLKVYPVRLPVRRVPDNPKRTDKIRIKLIESEEEYDVAWANIAKLEFYEQLVVA